MSFPPSPFAIPATPFEYIYKLTQLFDLWNNSRSANNGA